MRLWNYIKEEMQRNSTQLIFEKERILSYKDVITFSEMFARKITGEKCCAILCDSEMNAAKALLSCFAADVTAVPLSPRYGEQHCKKIMDLISPTSLITDKDGELQVVHMTESHYQEPQDEHPALIMCTSGTTGVPKGAMLSENNIMTNLKDIAAYLHIGCDDTILIARPLYHCAVLTGEFLLSLVKGTKICFYSDLFNPHSLLNVIDENNITVFGGTPTLISMMARFNRGNSNRSLKHINISGECMSAEVGKRIADAFPAAKIYHVYGLTEACPRVSYLPPEKFGEVPDSVGIPLKSVTLKLIAPTGEVAGVNEQGILWVRGDNVMLGYYNAPEQTARVLQDGWLCTGDIAVLDQNGLLRIKGRNDDLIIRAGMNIYPQEIESVLKRDKRVREILVYGLVHPYAGVQIGMKVAGDFKTIDEVKQLCMQTLPSYQMPSVIELLEELPKNGSGKIVRGKGHAGI